MVYTNDTIGTVTYVNDNEPGSTKWDDIVATWGDTAVLWDAGAVYTTDSIGTVSYSNDVKPS